MTDLPKLVRDSIPEVIEQNGENPVYRETDGDELEEFFREKFVEETEEFAENADKEELADLLEVTAGYCKVKDLDLD